VYENIEMMSNCEPPGLRLKVNVAKYYN